jgi:quercetin dioxygenase-like cupin family protein
MTGAGYTVRSVETIAESSEIRARLHTLGPDDVIPWHYHSDITDWYFCLSGVLRIERQTPPAEERLALGDRYTMPPNTAHRISNGGNGEDCRFLLLQGVGVYDFNKIDD